MDRFQKALSGAFGAEMAETFQSGALYYDCMDYVEYVAGEGVVVADRIDGYLTLLWNSTCDELIGFRIKGFKFLFNTRLKDIYSLSDNDFLPMISVIQAVVEQLGNELLADDARQHAYGQVYRLAQKSSANLYDLPTALAA